MGGERGATTRKKDAGEICCYCKAFLPTPHRRGQQACHRCQPKRPVHVTFFLRYHWTCCCLEADARTHIRTLHFADPEKLIEFARRGNALPDLAARQALDYAINMGRGGLTLQLTPDQYAKLKG